MKKKKKERIQRIFLDFFFQNYVDTGKGGKRDTWKGVGKELFLKEELS